MKTRKEMDAKAEALKAELLERIQPQPTPGPWKSRINIRERCIELATDNTHVASVRGGSQAEIEANARLIAAAPELLEALKQVLIEQDIDLSCELAEQIQQAIAKATGGK